MGLECGSWGPENDALEHVRTCNEHWRHLAKTMDRSMHGGNERAVPNGRSDRTVIN